LLGVQQAATVTILPVLVADTDSDYAAPDAGDFVFDRYLAGLRVGYAVGPPFGDRLVTWEELRRLGLSQPWLRQQSATYLDTIVDRVRIHGQPPALVLFFAGMEASAVLAAGLWEEVAGRVPGDVVIGVPARDVVIITGSRSAVGLARVRRDVDRVFASGRRHLLTRELFVRRGGQWRLWSDAEEHVRPPAGIGQPGR
jgi:uncharacterized protein YtpQ (UPF0354 family)